MPRTASLTNFDMTDRELLLVMNDCPIDEDGYVDTHDVADFLNLSHKNPTQCVGQRLSWMKRFGFVERHPDKEHMWRILPIGEDLMSGRLKRGLENSLDSLRPGEQLLVMRHITHTGYVTADAPVANAVRREYLHGAAQRKNGRKRYR